MKRFTVSLPDDLVEEIKRAAGGAGQVSAYVARALADYQSRESLAEILADWELETPVTEEVRRTVAAEFDAIGRVGPPTRTTRRTG